MALSFSSPALPGCVHHPTFHVATVLRLVGCCCLWSCRKACSCCAVWMMKSVRGSVAVACYSWPVLVSLGVGRRWAARPLAGPPASSLPLSCSATVLGSPPGATSSRGEPPPGSSPLGGFGCCVSLVSRGACSWPAGGEPPAGVSPLEAGSRRPSASRLSTCVSHWWYHSGWSSISICCWSSVARFGWLPLGSLLAMSCSVICLVQAGGAGR